ncbi:hypothetical protein [Streptomyces niveiscabiei]|uniref:Uncharacterized protein n=1 Tax=Streptomyces niveiscabiei TaxID=164115 RepID=A0ABW9I586_9ACTN
MTQAEVGGVDERVPGRRWTVRLDPVGRGGVVRVSCSRPACAEQRHPTAAEGRAAAVAHLKAHLRAAPAPRDGVYCACRADGCRTHMPAVGRSPRAEPWRCGGAVVLAVVTDREGRWWQAMECCSRCAAATPGARTVATAQAGGAQGADRPAGAGAHNPAHNPTHAPARTSATQGAAGAGPYAATGTGTPPSRPSVPQFSDQQPVTPQFSDHHPATPVPAPRPAPKAAPARRRPQIAKIAQRVIPHDLRPVELRDELIELGNLFRAYQKREQPDLSVLADLQERKARAFVAWADATSEGVLRFEAQRAEQAAATIRMQHEQRTGTGTGIAYSGPVDGVIDGDGPAVARLLTGLTQWEHARAVLAYVAEHAPLPGPEARLAVLMLTLRTAHTGTGNLVGQDLNGLGLTDPQALVEELTGSGWLEIPGTAEELLASRPENPTPITVPSLMPPEDGAGPFTFGKKMRPKLSGWAQRVVSDKKLRKKKAPATTRLLTLALAAQTDASGRLGPGGGGIALDRLTAWVPVDTAELKDLVEQLTAADWLAEADLTDTHLAGQLSERVLPVSCPLRKAESASEAGEAE